MIKNFVKLLELLGDRLEVCVSVCHEIKVLTLKAPITTAADDKISDIFPYFRKNKVWYFIRIVCKQTILMKYHALFVIFEKNSKIWNCHLLQIIGGALGVNTETNCAQQKKYELFSFLSVWIHTLTFSIPVIVLFSIFQSRQLQNVLIKLMAPFSTMLHMTAHCCWTRQTQVAFMWIGPQSARIPRQSVVIHVNKL